MFDGCFNKPKIYINFSMKMLFKSFWPPCSSCPSEPKLSQTSTNWSTETSWSVKDLYLTFEAKQTTLLKPRLKKIYFAIKIESKITFFVCHIIKFGIFFKWKHTKGWRSLVQFIDLAYPNYCLIFTSPWKMYLCLCVRFEMSVRSFMA